MQLDEVKKNVSILEYARSYSGSEIKKIGADTYRVDPCPVCGHKEHFTVYPKTNTFTSFSSCCKGGSVIDYFMQVEEMDQTAAINKAKKLAGADNVTDTGKIGATVKWGLKKSTDYYKSRGLDKTIEKYNLGYLPEGDKVHGVGKDFKYVLPVNDAFVILRSDNEADRYRNLGNPEVLNKRYLENPSLTGKQIFIVEGYFDALSLEELDHPAIALNSTSGTGKLVEALEANLENIRDKLFIISLDNDTAGADTAEKLANKMKLLGLKHITYNLPDYKDFNEALVKDRAGLQALLENSLQPAIEKTRLSGTVYEYLTDKFDTDLDRRANEKLLQSGIGGLDDALGGLYPGLFIIGAISSLGKTTIALQLADEIARVGQPVHFYSLEMGGFELICRSLTREVFKKGVYDGINTGHVLNGHYQGEDLRQSVMFKQVLEEYKEGPARHLSIIEGNFKTTIETIENRALGAMDRPVVIVDYLQVIQLPEGSRKNEKQHVDEVVVRLKQLSRSLDLPVIAVSSFNRNSYNVANGPSMAAFKESGLIEYGADVLLYMQLRVDGLKGSNNADDRVQDKILINEAKNAIPRPIDLIILKNRRGAAYQEIKTDYYTPQNLFVEMGTSKLSFLP